MLTIVTTCPEPSLSKDTERFFLQFPARAANFKTMVDCVGGQQQLEQHTSTHPPVRGGVGSSESAPPFFVSGRNLSTNSPATRTRGSYCGDDPVLLDLPRFDLSPTRIKILAIPVRLLGHEVRDASRP